MSNGPTHEELRAEYEAWFTRNNHGVQIATVDGATVPRCCIECSHFERGEYDEGYRVSGPWCQKNVIFPTRKGTCGKWVQR